MKRLAIQAMIISIILVLDFVFALHGAQSLEEMFFVVCTRLCSYQGTG